MLWTIWFEIFFYFLFYIYFGVGWQGLHDRIHREADDVNT